MPSIRATAAAVVTLALVVFGAGVAQAAPTLGESGITCLNGVQSVTYSPGLTFANEAHDIAVSTEYSACTSLSNPEVATGIFTIETNSVKSCLSPTFNDEISFTITWVTADDDLVGTSDVTVSRTVSDLGLTDLVNYVGTVTDGLFVGQPFIEEIVYLGVNPIIDCLGAGIERRDSIINITKIGL